MSCLQALIGVQRTGSIGRRDVFTSARKVRKTSSMWRGIIDVRTSYEAVSARDITAAIRGGHSDFKVGIAVKILVSAGFSQGQI